VNDDGNALSLSAKETLKVAEKNENPVELDETELSVKIERR